MAGVQNTAANRVICCVRMQASERRGKLLGVLDRLDHIRAVGATAVMLTPITAHAPGDGASWSSNPLCKYAHSRTRLKCSHQAHLQAYLIALLTSTYDNPRADRTGHRRSGLGPFGEAPVSYFAPEPRLAAGDGPDAASRELKQLAAALHREGIEVILQACCSCGCSPGHTVLHPPAARLFPHCCMLPDRHRQNACTVGAS